MIAFTACLVQKEAKSLLFCLGISKKGQIVKHPNPKVLPTRNSAKESMRTVNTLLNYPVD